MNGLKCTLLAFLFAACGGGDDCKPTQALSQGCCPSLGVDACGAGLFCAALDGRTDPTCYAEYTRMHGETCLENRDCVSQWCGGNGLCASLPGEACDSDSGCAGVGNLAYVCSSASSGTCVRRTD